MISQGLVNIQTLDSTILVDLKYSSKDNFFGEDVYGDFDKGFLQKKPAEELAKANDYLKTINPALRLLIYDATRPHSIQVILWEKLDSIPPKRRKDFVADPSEGSIHNYGCAVDLTLFDVNKQEPLDMGTKYDFFGDLAYPRLENKMQKLGKLSEQQISNRVLLRNVMKKYSFESINSEWWHFNFYSRAKAKELYKIVN
ncbi:peptidase M15 [Lacihabitans sp. LS3-19]|nr:peptidase M15 [Lacihabitans sp. LS3-19]